VEILHLYISTAHNFFGHHGRAADEYPTQEVDSIECVAGHGIRGDRFFDYRENYKGQITFFADEVYRALCERFGVFHKAPSVLRRNAITRGIDLNTLIGSEFEVQGVRLRGIEECRPCYWMDNAFAPGAEKFLRGKGGLRARILSDGELRITTPPDRAVILSEVEGSGVRASTLASDSSTALRFARNDSASSAT
jgi:MOSC domain-containing protein YiiM